MFDNNPFREYKKIMEKRRLSENNSKGVSKSFSQFLYEISANPPRDVRREIEKHLHAHYESITGKTYDERKATEDEAAFNASHGLEGPELHQDSLVDHFAGEAHKHFLENGDIEAAKKHGEELLNRHVGK